MVIWCCPIPIWQKETWFLVYKNHLKKWNTHEGMSDWRSNICLCNLYRYVKFLVKANPLWNVSSTWSSICTIPSSVDLIETDFIWCIFKSNCIVQRFSDYLCLFAMSMGAPTSGYCGHPHNAGSSNCLTQRHWYMNMLPCVSNFNVYVYYIYIYI